MVVINGNELAMEQMARGVVVFDLDGTLFNDEHRRHFLTTVGSPNAKPSADQYRRYHKAADADAPYPNVVNILHICIQHGFRIVFMTARPVEFWKSTKLQLNNLGFDGFEYGRDYELLMRPAENRGSSPELKRSMIQNFFNSAPNETAFVAAFDDRPDVIAMLKNYTTPFLVIDGNLFDDEAIRRHLDNHAALAKVEAVAVAQARTAADILAHGAATFRERNANYRDNAVQVGEVMRSLFPNGVTLKTEADHHFYHLFELMVVKLTRFANSELKHTDSIHDLMVYAAMCENVIEPHTIKVH